MGGGGRVSAVLGQTLWEQAGTSSISSLWELALDLAGSFVKQ